MADWKGHCIFLLSSGEPWASFHSDFIIQMAFKGVVDYWIRKIVSFFGGKLLWYQTIGIVVLLTVYCGHVCEYLQKKKSSECVKLSKLLIVEDSPARRAAAGGVHRFKWTNYLKVKMLWGDYSIHKYLPCGNLPTNLKKNCGNYTWINFFSTFWPEKIVFNQV